MATTPYWIAGEPLENVFRRIDEAGGWPLGANYLIVQHMIGPKRDCWFSKTKRHDEWNSTLCEADDYYVFKLSAERIAEIERAGADKLRSKLAAL